MQMLAFARLCDVALAAGAALQIGWPGNESRAVKDGAFEQLRELPGIIEASQI